jgi:hypothetical protein
VIERSGEQGSGEAAATRACVPNAGGSTARQSGLISTRGTDYAGLLRHPLVMDKLVVITFTDILPLSADGDAGNRVGAAAHTFRTILKLGTRDSEAASLGSISIGAEPAAKRYVRPEDGPVTVMPVCPR